MCWDFCDKGENRGAACLTPREGRGREGCEAAPQKSSEGLAMPLGKDCNPHHCENHKAKENVSRGGWDCPAWPGLTWVGRRPSWGLAQGWPPRMTHSCLEQPETYRNQRPGARNRTAPRALLAALLCWVRVYESSHRWVVGTMRGPLPLACFSRNTTLATAAKGSCRALPCLLNTCMLPLFAEHFFTSKNG